MIRLTDLLKESQINLNLPPFEFDQDGNESRINREINNKQGWRRLASNSDKNKQIKAYLDKYTSNFKWKSNIPKSEKFSKENENMYATPYVMYIHLLQTSEGVNNIEQALKGMIANEPEQSEKTIESALLLIYTNKKSDFLKAYEQYKDVIEKNIGTDDGTNVFNAIKYAASNFEDKEGIFKKFERNGFNAGQFKP